MFWLYQQENSTFLQAIENKGEIPGFDMTL
jgi:hypothetical protein